MQDRAWSDVAWPQNGPKTKNAESTLGLTPRSPSVARARNSTFLSSKFKGLRTCGYRSRGRLPSDGAESCPAGTARLAQLDALGNRVSRLRPRFDGWRGQVGTAMFPTMAEATVDESDLLQRITVTPEIFGGKPIVRGRRLAVEHVLGMLAAGDTPEVILGGYPWLEPEDIRACLVYARRLVGHERVEPLILKTGT
jgi:uncharacterized protein (DUF433 family)